jgi:hypothetical protein
VNILLGFGKAHFDLTKSKARELVDAVKMCKDEQTVKEYAEKYAESLGTYKTDKYEWAIFKIREVAVFSGYSQQHGIMIEGVHSHYRGDHPLSSDGFAMLDVHFAMVYINDDIWGERIYISTGE